MKLNSKILSLTFVLTAILLSACNINGNRTDDLLYERTNHPGDEGPPIERTHNNRSNVYDENDDKTDRLIRNEVNPLDRDGQEPKREDIKEEE
ncbi:hypothetical protein [Halobacillus massiliensis]|uniref:hypothetical protein n=1 Tax=Halobacillus massiliensis TaxID=1926286 RepID=UPI0009E39909|nr:hypothetical protein [Halobacillus massiliensis]